MSLQDSLVILPGSGFVYTAPVGTLKPVSLTDPALPWQNVGHTSTENNIVISRDGGDTKTLGSWQNPTLKVQRDPVSFAIVMDLLQWSNDTFSFYFGGGDTTVAGVFGVPINSVPQERAMFIRIIDGSSEFPLYIPKVSIASDDDMEADTEKLMEFPVRASVLAVTGSNLMEFYGSHLGLQVSEVQTVTITGVPTGGSFTLTFSGQTTAAIAWNATSAAVKSALVALSNITAGDIEVTGGPGPGTPYVVTFSGLYEDTDVPIMTAAGSFTGGTAPAVAVTTTTPGGN